MSKPDSYISVWFDDVSDEHGWIVDRCDEDGNSTTARFFPVESDSDDDDFDDEYESAKEDASVWAKAYSKKTGVPIR